MAAAVAYFFEIMGIGAAPATMAELIPYLLTVVVGIFLVAAMFGVFGKIVELLLTSWRRM